MPIADFKDEKEKEEYIEKVKQEDVGIQYDNTAKKLTDAMTSPIRKRTPLQMSNAGTQHEGVFWNEDPNNAFDPNSLPRNFVSEEYDDDENVTLMYHDFDYVGYQPGQLEIPSISPRNKNPNETF